MFNESHILRTTVILTLVISAGALIWSAQVSLGLLLGGLMSALTFRLMIIDATLLLHHAAGGSMDKRGAYRSSFRSFAKRCLFYSLALTVGILNPHLSFLATFAGLLLPRLAIFYHYLQGRTKRGS
ncbi:MAG: ATP synthase subunit I [Bacillota bacterium]|jgi:hypothetical protein|nr:ATP synthase subunit I [Bacillota bacterium]HHT90295.1 hypothetical protein [Bacillota bacterium]